MDSRTKSRLPSSAIGIKWHKVNTITGSMNSKLNLMKFLIQQRNLRKNIGFPMGYYQKIKTCFLYQTTDLNQLHRSLWKSVQHEKLSKYLLAIITLKVISFFIHFFRKKKYNFQTNILPLLALVIMGVTMHLLFIGQIRFRHPILLGIIAIAGISFYEIVFSIKNRYRKNDS